MIKCNHITKKDRRKGDYCGGIIESAIRLIENDPLHVNLVIMLIQNNEMKQDTNDRS